MADEYKEKYFRRCSCIMDFFQHYQLNVLLKNQTYLFSMLCSYWPRSKTRVGWAGGKRVKEDQADENQNFWAVSVEGISGHSRWTRENHIFVFVNGNDPICVKHWRAFLLSVCAAWFLKLLKILRAEHWRIPGNISWALGRLSPSVMTELHRWPVCYLRTLHTGNISNAITVLIAYKWL